MTRIRILHIIKSLGRGGAEMLLPETLKLHDQENFEFHFIYFLPWKDQMVKEIQNNGGIVSCFSATNNISILLQFQKVVSYCKSNKIDIIHCHLPWSGFLGRLVHSSSGIPVIYTEHNIQERYHKATKILNKITFNKQSLALGVSRDVTRSINENINPVIPVRTLLNGVNTAKFQKDNAKGRIIKKQFNIPEEALVIGNIAVFRQQKCIPDWIKAFKEINKYYPEVYGLLVGAGPEEQEVRSLVEELDLKDKIKLAGLQEDTVAYFSAMDIFMMSSQFEGLPIALLEAMSMKCAIVSTRAGGVVEVVNEGENGFLCDVGNWSCLAEKSKILIKDKKQRNQFSEAARERVKSTFSLQIMVNELELHYRSFTRL